MHLEIRVLNESSRKVGFQHKIGLHHHKLSQAYSSHLISTIPVFMRFDSIRCDSQLRSVVQLRKTASVQAFLSTCAIWRHWPLRSICLSELRVVADSSAALGKALSSAAPKVLRVRAAFWVLGGAWVIWVCPKNGRHQKMARSMKS